MKSFKLVSIFLTLSLAFLTQMASATNKLPSTFTAPLGGSDKNFEVTATAVSALTYDGSTTNDIDFLAKTFLNLNTGHSDQPNNFQPNLTIYKIEAKKDSEKIWIGNHSSMGIDSAQRILAALQDNLSWPSASKCNSFTRTEHSVGQAILGEANLSYVVEVAQNLRQVYSTLMANPDDLHRQANETLYRRACTLNSFEHIWFNAFFVSPIPSEGSTDYIHLILYTDGYQE